VGPRAGDQAADASGNLWAVDDALPAANHLQYRFKAEGSITRLSFLHRAIGLIPAEQRDGFHDGWGFWVERIRELAERKNRKETKR
jgi:hypothetical protein